MSRRAMGIAYAMYAPMVLADVTALKAMTLLREKRAKQKDSSSETQTATMGVWVLLGDQCRKLLKGMALSRVMAKSCGKKELPCFPSFGFDHVRVSKLRLLAKEGVYNTASCSQPARSGVRLTLEC
jgi:hypothetical protein